MTAVPGGGYESLLLRQQFAVTAIDLKVNPMRAATVARDRWLEQHLVGILDRLLDRGDRVVDGRRVATHVVLEIVLNAVAHPEAQMAFLSSQIDPPVRGSDTRRLRLAIWDDGLSLAETLGAALIRAGSITSAAYGSVREEFEVEVQRGPGEPRLLRLVGTDPKLPRDPDLLNVVAFMMGVTSRPHEKRPISDSRRALRSETSPLSEQVLDQGGLGLYLVRKTAIDLFGGTIDYKTGSNRYRIAGTDRPGIYKVTSANSEASGCPIRGNLLEIIIPLAGDHA